MRPIVSTKRRGGFRKLIKNKYIFLKPNQHLTYACVKKYKKKNFSLLTVNLQFFFLLMCDTIKRKHYFG